MIPNHFSHGLSELDLVMARFVPPGGNWKNIPVEVPSNRLAQIRESFAAGEGSRSTYYGRLRNDRPAYTINTYFNRPGNGCFLHYDFTGKQHRTISQREAARLQSFPDEFRFSGSRQSVNKQIGNAVPPLLALQIGLGFREPGAFIDLFSGAGGLSLGFSWAGWRQVVANDIEKAFLESYRQNLGGEVVHGDIARAEVLDELITVARARRRSLSSGPLIVLGGPPCQGFSTAGKKRSMEDVRNHLFKQYVKVLDLLNIDAFVFENVPGILNMQGGAVFRAITDALQLSGYELRTWILGAEQFGVPQRRTRVFVIGVKGALRIAAPRPLTGSDDELALLKPSTRLFTAEDALSDLPRIEAGEDGSALEYAGGPYNQFQKFVRGDLSAREFVSTERGMLAA